MDYTAFINRPSYISPHYSDYGYSSSYVAKQPRRNVVIEYNGELPVFKKITSENMPEIWKILRTEKGRTTDFSYAGILMWVDYFKYEYAILNDTLFIKGVVENDTSTVAFSLPVGKMDLSESLGIIKAYCKANNLRPELSAVPEYAMDEIKQYNPSYIEELTDWADYLYDSEKLATLSGKKMGKKRNHVNKFMSLYPDYKLEPLTSENAHEAMEFMDTFDLEGDSTEMAIIERKLSRDLISAVEQGDRNLLGALLKVDGKVCAYTIGDIKGDTLFIHVEKATRAIEGSYEAINKLFAEVITRSYPVIRFINREDAAGDDGLKKAKESYHPVELLRKYNVIL